MRKFIVLFFVVSSIIISSSSLGQVLYVHPKPNSTDVRPQSTIILKVSNSSNFILNPSEFSFDVSGSNSGIVEGKVIVIRNTIIFKPEKEFDTEENIYVNVSSQHIGSEPLSFSFKTSALLEVIEEIDDLHLSEINTLEKANPNVVQEELLAEPTVINGVAVPRDFPILQPFLNSGNTAPGRLFFSFMQDSNPYITILENDGKPYFYRRVDRRTRDFKLQPTGQLSRMVTPSSGLSDGWEVLDSNYYRIGVYPAKGGYSTDDHEFVMTMDGTYLIVAADYRTIDGKSYRGNHVQEVDFETGEVVFMWLSWDHLDIDDAMFSGSDYIHMNSIAVDYDNNLVMSLRNQNQCIKIDRTTGDIIWRLGGKKNQFNFINDEYKIAYQHHFRPVPGKPDHYTVFDNGEHRTPKFSRGVEFKLDTDNMTAENVWEYRASPDRYSHWMGSVQRLPNGNTLIDWADASLPKPTEVTPSGARIYDANFSVPSHVYRAFRFEWEAQMIEPYLFVEPSSSFIRLIFNKFGDKSVVSYNIYVDPFENPTTLLASSTETWYDVNTSKLKNQTNYHFRVTAVNAQGEESPYSNEEEVFINYVQPGNSSAILGPTPLADPEDPKWIDGESNFGTALNFDGYNDFVNCGNDPSLQITGSYITLEAWIKPFSWKDEVWEANVLSKGEATSANLDEGYMIRAGKNGTVNFNLGGEGSDDKWNELNTPENTISLHTWHHVAATYDGVTMKIYVDGEEKASKNDFINIGDASGVPLHIGQSPHFSSRNFPGMIDEVRVWNIARSQIEILSTMNSELDPEIYTDENSGLVGYWQFNEGTGQLTADLAKSYDLILNGNFNDSDNYWDFSKTPETIADYYVDGHYYVNITEGGSYQTEISISQNNIALTKDEKYILKFDGWAESDKFINVKIRKATSPYTDYTKIGAVYINSTEQSFEYPFEMTDLSDGISQIVFMVGGDNNDIFIDNVSLKYELSTGISESNEIATEYKLFNNYPNPFNPTTQIEYHLPKASYVKLTIYNTLGQKVVSYINSEQSAGTHKKEISFGNFSSGLYFYSLEAKGINSGEHFHEVKKMILIK